MDSAGSVSGVPAPARVAIVGAGYAGLAAAVKLSLAGLSPVVFEAAGEPGGRARRVHTPEGVFDNGLHIGLGAYTRLLALSAEVGAGEAWARRRLDWRIGRSLRLRAAPLPAPLHLVAGLLLARGLPPSARLQAAWFVARLRLAGWQVPAEEALPGLLDRLAQGESIRERLWHPLCVAALNTPPARASARVFACVLRDSLGADRHASDLLLPRVDLTEAFPGPALRWLQGRGAGVHLRTRVTRVVQAQAGWQVSTAPPAAAITDAAPDFRAVVLAVAPRALAHLTEDWPALAPVHAIAAAQAQEPITSLYLRYPGRTRLPAPMIGLDGGPGQWAFDREALCGQSGVIGVVISASAAERATGGEALGAAVHRQLAGLMPGLPQPLGHRVITERMATFACTPGCDRVPMRTAAPGVFIAGDHVRSDWPATLEGAVRSGEAAAAAVVDWLGR